MFVAGAPTPGSGKGLLIDAASIIATGRPAPKMAAADNEEMRKRLFAIALESPQVVCIDNVEGRLGGAALAMALTAGVVTDRVLGQTATRSVSLRCVFSATGNNVQLVGDLGRRVVPIDIDPRCEHPEDRDKFRHPDLLGYVTRNRPRLYVAAMTILRGFFAAGRPGHGKPAKGSYEPWDQLVRGAIIWAGGADPLAGTERIRAQGDEDIDRLRELLAAWRETLGDREVTTADAVKAAGDEGRFHEAIAAYCRRGQVDARALGYALRRYHGRIAGGMAIARAPISRGANRWRVKVESGGHGGHGGHVSGDAGPRSDGSTGDQGPDRPDQCQPSPPCPPLGDDVEVF